MILNNWDVKISWLVKKIISRNQTKNKYFNNRKDDILYR